MVKNNVGFKFRTREEYKRVKGMDRAQLEAYIQMQKDVATQARPIANEIALQQARKRGWDLCVEETQKVLDSYVKETLDEIDSCLIEAIQQTRGIGQIRGQELLDNLAACKQKLQKEQAKRNEEFVRDLKDKEATNESGL